MHRAMILRPVLFTLYGLGIGVAYVAFLNLWLKTEGVDRFCLWILPAFFGFIGWGTAYTSEWSNTQRLLFVILWPISLVAGGIAIAGFLLTVVLVFLPISWVRFRRAERRFRNQMESRGRFLSAGELGRRLDSGEGTLIEETGHKGPYHIWWTEEEVLAKGSPPETDEDFFAVLRGKDHPFNTQCLQEYLDPDTGKAFLTCLAARQIKSRRFTRVYPKVPVVMVVRPIGS